MKRYLLAVLMILLLVAAGAASAEDVTLEFQQWWEPELPEGSFRAILDEFEAANPGIKVETISGPYLTTKDQIIASAATGTMADVVGLDGAWVNVLWKQGALASLSQAMMDADYDDSELAAQIRLAGQTYMIPIANFIYPVFVNLDMLAEAGIEPPTTRAEFAAAAIALTDPDNNVYGWAQPLSLEQPNGIQNDTMSWLWASGGSMLDEMGQPHLAGNEALSDTLEFLKSLHDAGVVAPGSFSMKENEKVEEFVNERVAMIVNTLAHFTLIRERNPDLNFDITALPAAEGYDGPRGLPYASWGIGISSNTEHQAEAWKLIDFLTSVEGNSKLTSIANAFPGNVNATPDFITTDPLFETAFEIFQEGYLANEFTGLPAAEELMRQMAEPFQFYLEGDIEVDELLELAQAEWEDIFE
ncbi:MAG: sugar ABC transporter substrate-binding protein [Chloroflexi bacterium]|nr:sugar ABC transporter substrate-binding protein [Chloroflexota bacterium]MDE2651405.1 sugar ABC transporter substrate-binding protein [Chloroflexota bacterium]MXV93075.1 sugar ABC transporter substrate-binding protein [Chloroflexota bacterium]MXX50865.1 sugar ABC transporter substrate-binding protein [Chloroflexota bacterium]MXX82962.1 sugar ABC transporter substrate-binding protein [Chloroflexota bacterium]